MSTRRYDTKKKREIAYAMKHVFDSYLYGVVIPSLGNAHTGDITGVMECMQDEMLTYLRSRGATV